MAFKMLTNADVSLLNRSSQDSCGGRKREWFYTLEFLDSTVGWACLFAESQACTVNMCVNPSGKAKCLISRMIQLF